MKYVCQTPFLHDDPVQSHPPANSTLHRSLHGRMTLLFTALTLISFLFPCLCCQDRSQRLLASRLSQCRQSAHTALPWAPAPQQGLKQTQLMPRGPG